MTQERTLIDWLKIRFLKNHNPVGTRYIEVWDKHSDMPIKQVYRGEFVEGSYTSKIWVQSRDITPLGARELVISGSPAKFLQGHNLFGSNDVRAIAKVFVIAVLKHLGIEVTSDDEDALTRGVYNISRVDITESYRAGTREAANAYIHQLGAVNACKYKVTHAGSTRYFDSASKRRSIKVYSKAEELDAHPLPENLPLRSSLVEWAEGIVRVELTLKSRELTSSELSKGSQWKAGTAARLFDKYTGKLAAPDSVTVSSKTLSDMAPAYYKTFCEWQKGIDITTLIPCRQKRYRHSKYLLTHYGIDISNPPGPETAQEELVTVEPALVPIWAVKTPVYVNPQAS
jgi:II/X family phage/plasmid replication protein